MPELLLILLKINLVLLLFAAAYYLVLRRLTFYTINRAFLIVGIVFSTIYPFINLTDFFQRQAQINPKVAGLVPTLDVNALIKSNTILDYWQILVVVFYVGVGCMILRLIAQFISLYRVHQSSQPGSVGDLPVRILRGKVSPFSFWQTVYVNPTIHSANELDTILAHEQVHVKEWHTLDIILAEISVVFYWFNPGVWLMKRAIKENIEFITDARIVKKGIDKKAYQYSLLGVGNLQASVALVNHFNLSDLKKRITMMNAKRSSPKKLVIYALIFPVLLITALGFTINKKEVKRHLMPLTKALVKVNLFSEPVTKIEAIIPKIKAKRKSILPELTISKKDTLKNVRFVMRTILLSDSLHTFSALPEMVALVRNEHIGSALRGDSILKGGPVKRIENISIAIRKPLGTKLTSFDDIGLHEVIVRSYGSKTTKPNDSVKIVMGKPLYLINGKPINKEEFEKIKAEDIKSVTIKAVNKVPGILIGTQN